MKISGKVFTQAVKAVLLQKPKTKPKPITRRPTQTELNQKWRLERKDSTEI